MRRFWSWLTGRHVVDDYPQARVRRLLVAFPSKPYELDIEQHQLLWYERESIRRTPETWFQD
jgi:hypothetical protein